MIIRVVTEVSDHLRSYTAEEVYEVADEQGQRWIAAGLAIAAEEEPEGPETAALEGGPETGTLPRPPKRPRAT